MKTAIYDKNGIKIAGDSSLPGTLGAEILASELPLFSGGYLYSRENDGSISIISDSEGILGYFEENSGKITKSEFLKKVLFGSLGDEIKEMCKKYSFSFDELRRVYVCELNDDISEYVPIMQEAFVDENIEIIQLDAHRMAFICEELDNDMQETANAISATFTELGIDHNIGIGAVSENVFELANSFEQAVISIRTGKKISYSSGIWVYSYIFPEYMISLCDREKLQEIKTKAERVLSTLDEETIALAQEYFKHNLNISETARCCYLHRNTLIYRLDRIQKETGFDLRNFDESVTFRLYIAASKVKK